MRRYWRTYIHFSYSIFSLLLLVTVLLLLNACSLQLPQNYLTTADLQKQIDSDLQQSKQAMVLQNHQLTRTRVNAHKASKEKPKTYFDLWADRIPSQLFFNNLAKQSNHNIVVDPQIDGTISLDLHHVSFDQLLMVLQNSYGYDSQKTDYGYTIAKRHRYTRLFPINYLNIDRTGVAETAINGGEMNQSASETKKSGSSHLGKGQAAQSSAIMTKTTDHFWLEIKKTLAMIIGCDATKCDQNVTNSNSVTVNPQTGMVVVRAYKKQLDEVATYLADVQQITHRQVIIEAKILEVTLSADYQNGIDWHLLGFKTTGANVATSGGFTNLLTLSAKLNRNFTSFIRLLNQQGRVNVLSSPRITTINNQKAIIKIGEDQFFVTGVDSVVDNNVSGSSASQDVALTPFFSGIALDVTPQIDGHGNIILHIHPLISKVSEMEKKFIVGGQEQKLPLAASAIRESDNIVRVHNGQVIVIGGLMENSSYNNQGRTPILGDIPLLGQAFNNHQYQADKKEIVILLKPLLFNADHDTKMLASMSQALAQSTKPFKFKTHLGTSPSKKE